MGAKKRKKKDAEFIVEAFIRVMQDDPTLPDTSGSVSEELEGARKKKKH